MADITIFFDVIASYAHGLFLISCPCICARLSRYIAYFVQVTGTETTSRLFCDHMNCTCPQTQHNAAALSPYATMSADEKDWDAHHNANTFWEQCGHPLDSLPPPCRHIPTCDLNGAENHNENTKQHGRGCREGRAGVWRGFETAGVQPPRVGRAYKQKDGNQR